MRLDPPPHDLLVHGGMLLLALAVPASMVMGLFVRRPQACVAIAWMLGTSGWAAQQGLLRDIEPRPPLIVVLTGVSLIAALWVGTAGRRTWLRPLDGTPAIAMLLTSQVFRLPLELLMLRASLLGIMPVEFSMLGYNWDVITGLSAVSLVGWLLARGPGRLPPARVFWFCVAGWNLWGMASLGVILVLAVLTSPTVHAFGTHPEAINAWVLFFPYVWLPVVLVPMAVLGHALVTRWLIDNCVRAA